MATLLNMSDLLHAAVLSVLNLTMMTLPALQKYVPVQTVIRGNDIFY